MTSNGRYAFVGTSQGPVEVFDLARWRWVDRVGRDVKGPSYVAVSPDNRWLAVAYAGAKKLELHDMADPYVLTRRVIRADLTETPTGLLIAGHEGQLYVVHSKGLVAFDWSSGKEVSRISVALGQHPVLLPGGRFALSGGEHSVCSVDLQSGKQLRCVRVAGFHSMVLAPDGRTAYAAGADGITVMELTEGETPGE